MINRNIFVTMSIAFDLFMTSSITMSKTSYDSPTSMEIISS